MRPNTFGPVSTVEEPIPHCAVTVLNRSGLHLLALARPVSKTHMRHPQLRTQTVITLILEARQCGSD